MKADRRAHLRRVRARRASSSSTRNYPPTINHAAETEFARRVMADIVGADNVLSSSRRWAPRTSAYFLQAKPGCYFLIGNGDGSHRDGGHGMGPCMLHNPSYDFNDDLIPLGATLLGAPGRSLAGAAAQLITTQAQSRCEGVGAACAGARGSAAVPAQRRAASTLPRGRR